MSRNVVALTRAWVVALSVAAFGGAAWAQDYSNPFIGSLRLETRPNNATKLNITSNVVNDSVSVTLPFGFPYYGRLYTTMRVTTSGFMVAGGTSSMSNQNTNTANHGQDQSSGAFPYSPSGVGGASDVDGLIAPLWGALSSLNISSTSGAVYTWTKGTQPNRLFIVSWEKAKTTPATGPGFTAQAHLYENNGQVVFAYSADDSSSPYQGLSYVTGIDSYGDSRFTCPLQNHWHNHGYPGTDFVFDPRTVTTTGRALYDRIVSDANGIGNSTQSGRPLGRIQVDLRRDGGILCNTGFSIDDGNLSVPAFGVASTSSGTCEALASNVACSVSASAGGPPVSWTLSSSLSYSSDASLGTLTLGASTDANGTTRAAFNVARLCLAAFDWASTRTTAVIPRLDVHVEAATGFPSDYRTAGATPALLRIANQPSGNSDSWDDAIVTRTYARHVLATIAASPTTATDSRFDATTDTQNAFAEAFGYFVWAAMSGSSVAIDGTGSNTAVVHDLESPAVTVTKGPSVPGCVAGALFDLLDGANETADAVDGTLDPDRVFRIVDTFTVCPTADTFLQAWVDQGYDAAAVTRVFVGNGALVDDALEPNDSRDEAALLGPIGVRRSNLVLNRFNEDWFTVTVTAQIPSLVADATYDRTSGGPTVGVEIRNMAGTVLATGAPVGTTGPIRASTGTLAAGTYKVGVKHLSGTTVATYSVQAYEPLDYSAEPLTDWTVGRPYDVDLGVSGGIAPYGLTTPSSALPPGISYRAADRHAFGTPTDVGVFGVTTQLTDNGSPANTLTRSQTITIHDVLRIAVAPFVGFPAGKAVNASLPTTGGTPPFTLSMTAGALPTGLSLTPNSLLLTGTAAPQPATSFELDGVDGAGSADHVATRGVVAVQLTGKNIPADLAAGDDACGWWFDAVQGSTVSFKVTTAKGRAKRTLAGVVLAPDRSVVATGTIKPKLGSLAGSKIVCPLSGRYYVVASSADGEATQLLATVAVAPPKAGKAKLIDFAPSDSTTIEVGALAGAKLTLKFAGDKKQALTARVVSVLDPTGAPVPFQASVKTTATGGTLTLDLPTGGTWTVTLGATSTSGNAGKFAWSYAVKQPKGVSYSAD